MQEENADWDGDDSDDDDGNGNAVAEKGRDYADKEDETEAVVHGTVRFL